MNASRTNEASFVVTSCPPRTSPSMHIAVLETGSFTVGQTNALSGLFISDEDGELRHFGWPNVRCFGVAVHPHNPDVILLACGNGVQLTRDGGESWRVLTDWRVTEVLDVAFDRTNPDQHFICASAYGIWESRDSGETWSQASDGLVARFAQSIATSPNDDRIWAGTEAGVFVAPVDKLDWSRDGLVGFPVREIATTPSGFQVAATKAQGAWVRMIDGPWTRIRGVPADATCYAVASRPDGKRMAVGGLFSGVYLSRDGGRSASLLNSPATPDSPVHALAFNPDANRLIAGTTGEGLFEIDLGAGAWTPLGLLGASIRRILP